MIGILALACLLVGFIAGWLLRAVANMAHLSWSQEQMQKKVRYWQDEAIRARDIAEQLTRRLAAITGHKGEPPDWPTAGVV
jgi:hypothetical protein